MQIRIKSTRKMVFHSNVFYFSFMILSLASVFGLHDLDRILSQAQQDECREESNYRGDLLPSGGSPNVTQELKCFAACSLIKLGIMDQKEGTVNTTKLEELINAQIGSKDAADVFETTVVEPCMKEVNKTSDYCEYSYQLVACGINRMKPPTVAAG